MGVVMEKQPGGNPEFTQCLASCQKSVRILGAEGRFSIEDHGTTMMLRGVGPRGCAGDSRKTTAWDQI